MNSKSFTLIELMTVVAIMAILSGITLIGFNLFLKQGKIAKSMAFDSSIHFNLGYAIKGDWKMDDNAANSTVVDTSGYNNDGTFYSGGSADNTANHSVDGANGTALEFDGVDDYVGLTITSDLGLSDSMTASFWIKSDSSGSGVILSNEPINEWDGDFSILADNYKFYQATDDKKILFFNTNLVDSEWHLVTIIHSGTVAKVYIDGNLDAEDSSFYDFVANSHEAVTIGSDNYEPFNGTIDQVRIYSEAFSISQAKYQYYTGLQRLYDKGLMSGKEYKSRIVKLNSES